jgi:hypothetical protein
LVAALGVMLAAAAPSSASQVLERGVRSATLAVDGKGEALVTYRLANGTVRRVLAWGAINALQPTPGGHQVHFQLDYSGGYGKYHKVYWKTFANTCTRYDGPALPYVVAACKASDGSYWALQSWDAFWPDLGFTPWKASQGYVLTLSHWTGPLAVLDAHVHWIYNGRFRQIFGTYTYDGKPVYGFKTTQFGAPVDSFGRLVYVDTFDAPAYGSGWRRENSFVAHQGTGGFCYGLFTFNPLHGGYAHPPGYKGGLRGPGVGKAYRISGEGPGVTPDVAVTLQDPGAWNAKDPAMVQAEDQDATLMSQLHLAGCATK